MSDITKCRDFLCPSKEKCWRYTAPADKQWQSYGKFNREEDADNCDMFWNNKKCEYCGLENGIHKLSCPTMKVTILL
jgi:hypothetical protein